ncbi:HIT-like domain [Phaffia rhodozyma]|uniref:HIT-like domain n=1 Tax=Phaffia rhodozyma TaxID=264483 RepID=A0A0F7SGY3_PHARH|nr:HIT-like domain [Phaffia rhodozyma]
MLQTMAALSLDALGRSTSISSLGQTKLGFHIPPFTSVDHLHLHAFELPHKRLANVEFKSTWLSKPKLGKGWGWFVDIDQTIDILKSGQNVKIKPVHVGQN